MNSKTSSKHDLQELSIICSVKVDTADRIRNLTLICRFLQSFFVNWEFIIVEQGIEQQVAPNLQANGLRHYFIDTEDAHYKTRNLNMAAALSNRQYVLMLDADVILQPDAIVDGLRKLKSGVEFIYPFNGIVLNLAKPLFNDDTDPCELLENLEFVPKNYDQRTLQLELKAGVSLMSGANSYDATGGALMFKRESFFLVGGYNTNIISYGHEDMEFDHRIRTLGFSPNKLDGYNMYHLDHARLAESHYNNYYRSNEREYDRVRSMTAAELKRYANRGFSSVQLNTQHDLQVIDSPHEHTIRVSPHDRLRLSNNSLVCVVRYLSKRPVVGLIELLDYLEKYFDDYEIIIVELVSRRLKYLENKKNLQYAWLNHESTMDDGVVVGCGLTRRQDVSICQMDGVLDFTEIRQTYETQLNNFKQQLQIRETKATAELPPS